MRAKAQSRSPLASPGRNRVFARRAEGAHRIDRADAAVDRGEAGDGRIDEGHLREEGHEAAERGAVAAVLPIDEQAPVAGGGQVVEHLVGDFVVGVVEAAGRTMAADNVERMAMTCATSGGVLSWATSNSSTGSVRSQTARWMGLLTV